jgi:hypothetical protein
MADKPNPAAAKIAREANAYILAVDASLYEMTVHAVGPDPEPIDLFCECGCLGCVASTSAAYEHKGGAWLEGHQPEP